MPVVEPRTHKQFQLHPEYTTVKPLWEKCRDAVAGEDTLKAHHSKYLPALPELTGKEMQVYVKRSMYYNAPGESVSGLTGTVLRKPPVISYPDSESDQLKTIGVRDEPLPSLLRDTLTEVLTVGRTGYLVDAVSASDTTPNPRPYISGYKAESIWNWEQTRVGERLITTGWVLHEKISASDDPFFGGGGEIDQWRVLRLGYEPPIDDEESIALAAKGDPRAQAQMQSGIRRELTAPSDAEQRFYWQEIWTRKRDATGKETQGVVLRRVVVPMAAGGKLWRVIPFQIVNQSSEQPQVQHPPLLSLVNVALSHFKDSADLQWGMFWTAIPSPWASGVTTNDETPVIGAARITIFSEPDAKMDYAEFNGAGLATIQASMDKKKRLMDVLGSRLTDDQKAGVEAAEAIRLRLQGDSATLGGIALTASLAWTRLLQWVWDWQHPAVIADPEIAVELNTDFNQARLSAQDMGQLMAALASGYIDFDTWYYQLQKGEIVPPGMTKEEMVANILSGTLGLAIGQETAAMLMAQLQDAGAMPKIQEQADGLEPEGEDTEQ